MGGQKCCKIFDGSNTLCARPVGRTKKISRDAAVFICLSISSFSQQQLRSEKLFHLEYLFRLQLYSSSAEVNQVLFEVLLLS